MSDNTTTQAEPDHGSRDHAEYSPSGLKMHAGCSGYVKQDETGKDMSAAEKGTRIHEALEVRDPQALHDEEELSIYETIIKMEDSFLSNFPADREDVNEVRVDIELNDGESTFGTFDRLSLWESQPTFAVLGDYKSGVSIIDPAYKNLQGKAYTVGLFQKYPDLTDITVVFYVPFHDGEVVSDAMHHTFRRRDVPALQAELTEIIVNARKTTTLWEGEPQSWPKPDALCPSDNCRFCEREEVGCPALGGLVIDVAKAVAPDVAESLTFDPESDDPVEVQKRYLIAKIVGSWADREKRRIVDMAKEGMEFPGLRLRSMGRVTKINDTDMLRNITYAMGLDDKDLISLGSFPLKKVANAVALAVEGTPSERESEFLDACDGAGILTTSAERFTLADKK